MFASDRDLLIAEPGVLNEVGWFGQTIAQSDIASIDASGLLLTASDGGFTGAGIDGGYIALAGDRAYEIIGVSSATQMLISRVRARLDDPPVGGIPGSGIRLRVTTFRPQIELVHRQLMRMGGIEENDIEADRAVTESQIVNGTDLRPIEVFGALYLIYLSASAGSNPGHPSIQKADRYRDRFELERRRVGIRIDLDGDGEADAVRRLNSFRFARS